MTDNGSKAAGAPHGAGSITSVSISASGATDALPTWSDLMLPNYGTPPLTLVSGRGSHVTDSQGNTYTDLLGGIAVNILGHAHPAIVEAVARQVATLGHTSNLYANPQALALAARLQALRPATRAFFCNSGAEANEAALKTVRKHAAAADRRDGVVLAFEKGFHGRTMGSLGLTGQPHHRAGFEPFPGQVVHIPFNDPGAIEHAFSTHDVVGVFAEAVQGEGGITPMTAAAARALAVQCKAHDAVLVMDEVQAGMGRTGRFFAFEHLGLDPDIVTLAKGLGGGLPIGATLVRKSVAAVMGPGSHGSTFGGNPVACAAANAVLDTIDAERLVARAGRKGRMMVGALDGAGLQPRGMGLLLGIPTPGGAAAAVTAMRTHGYLVGQAGADTVRLAPALNIGEVELMAGAIALQKAVAG